jgi:hypothetical protein
MAKVGSHSQFDGTVQSLARLAVALVWISGLASVEGCSSSKVFGEYRVIKKTDSDTDRVVVSLEEDTRYLSTKKDESSSF